MRSFAWLLILAIPLRLAAQDIYTDEESTPPPMNDAVPMAKGGEEESSNSQPVQNDNPPENTPAPKKQKAADVYTEDANSEEQAPSYSEAAPVADRPRNSGPVNTQGSSLYDEMEAGYAKDMGDDGDSGDEEFVDDKKQKNKRGSQKTAKKNGKNSIVVQEQNPEDFETTHWHFGANVEYANQFSHSNTHGYGLGFQGLMQVNKGLFVGAALLWDRFHESVGYDTLKVSIARTAHHYLIGPMMRFELDSVSFDAVVGWDKMNTQFTITDQTTGQNLNAALGLPNSGKYNDSALGMAFRVGYSIELDVNWLLDLYASYAIGFYTGQSVAKDKKARMPQQLGLGTTIWYKN